MKIRNNYYTYPVLSIYNNDYIESVFEVNYSIEAKEHGTKIILIDVNLVDPTLENKMKNDEASLYVHLESPSTSYRSIRKFNRVGLIEINIEENVMQDYLEINTLILANTEISNYKSENFNKEIFGEEYFVSYLPKGSILAASITQELKIENTRDLLSNLPSIISVAEKKEISFMEIDYDSDVILIYLPTTLYGQYNLLSKKGLGDFVLTSTIIPALVYIIDQMPIIADSYDSNQWFKVISKKLEEQNIKIEQINNPIQSVRIVQEIFSKPLERAFLEGQILIEELDKS